MKAKKYLLLTNINIPVNLLEKLSNDSTESFDFLIHSTEKESIHYSDLRNIKQVLNRLTDLGIPIFYLSGAFSLFVINQLLEYDIRPDRKVYFLFSYLTKHLPKKNNNYKTHKNCRELIEHKYLNSTFIYSFLLDKEYTRYFKNMDKKEKSLSDGLYPLVIKPDILLKKVMAIDIQPRAKEIVITNDIFKNLTVLNIKMLLRKISREMLNPATYLYGKELRDFLNSIQSILKLELYAQKTIEI